MKKKIMMLALLCALLVGLVPPSSARAGVEDFPDLPSGFAYEYYFAKEWTTGRYYLYGSELPFYFSSKANGITSDSDFAFYEWNGSSWSSAEIKKAGSGWNHNDIIISNHNILYQDGTIFFSANVVKGYSFANWCKDAGLSCSASTNESNSVIPFWYEPDNYNYIVSKNLTASSTSGIYNLLMIQKSDGAHYPYHFQVSDIDYLGIAGAFADINRFTVRKFNYDPEGEGWKLIMQHDISELPFDHADFTFDENTVFLYSDTDIYADRAASSVWQYASTEYYNVEIPEPEITRVPVNPGTGSVGGQAKPGGMLDFIITFFTLVWTKLFAVEVPVDGYNISFQAIVIFGAVAGVLIWLGKSSFGKKG